MLEDDATLIALNLDFYERFAADFAAKRERSTALWAEALGRLPDAPRVLDLGCGHGRFLKTLMRRPGRVAGGCYCGIDGSRAMLRLASKLQTTALDCCWEHRCFDGDLRLTAHRGRYELVVLWAVLHHLPSSALRARLITEAATCVAPGGQLLLSAWDLEALGRARAGLRVQQLGPRDLLLGWDQHPGARRYCHQLSEAELAAHTERLLAEGLMLKAGFPARAGYDRVLCFSRPSPSASLRRDG